MSNNRLVDSVNLEKNIDTFNRLYAIFFQTSALCTGLSRVGNCLMFVLTEL